MNLTVVGPRVFIRPDKLPEQTESGLHIVYDRQDATVSGRVVALGDGPTTSKGVTLDHFVSVGDRVVFSPSAGQEVFFEREVFISVDENDILAVIDGD